MPCSNALCPTRRISTARLMPNSARVCSSTLGWRRRFFFRRRKSYAAASRFPSRPGCATIMARWPRCWCRHQRDRSWRQSKPFSGSIIPSKKTPRGMYDQCEELAGAEADKILQQLREAPEVRVVPNVDGPHVMEATRRALAKAGYELEV